MGAAADMQPTPTAARFRRTFILRSLLAALPTGLWTPAPPALATAAPRRQTWSSSDGACSFSVPSSWSLAEVCSPDRMREACDAAGRRLIAASQSPDGGALATVTIDLGAYGKQLQDYASLQTVSDGLLAVLPATTRLREASVATARSGSLAPSYYVLRFEAGEELTLVKLTVRQSRLYTLTLRTTATPRSTTAQAELEGVLASFDAYPVSSLRGGLLSSTAPALLRAPPPLDAALRLRGGLRPTGAAVATRRPAAAPPRRRAPLAAEARAPAVAATAAAAAAASLLLLRASPAAAGVDVYEEVRRASGPAAISVRSPPDLAQSAPQVLRLCPDDRVTCVSSLDAGHFLEPWECARPQPACPDRNRPLPSHDRVRLCRGPPLRPRICPPYRRYDGQLERAVGRVAAAAAAEGALSVARDESAEPQGVALRVSFPRGDAAIFWFPRDDLLVNFRSERADGSVWDRAANKLRLDRMRKALGYAPAPMVKNRRAKPSERRPDGSFQLEEERPYKRQDGRFYGEQGGGEGSGAGGLPLLGSPEAVRRLLFPFGRLGGRGSPAQALYDDLSDLATMPARTN